MTARPPWRELCRGFGVSLVAASSLSAAAAQEPRAAPPTAFVHVNVVPMDRERVLKDQTVVVRDRRISALGPSARVPVPAGAVQIDGRGKFLIPGLADMHAHTDGVLDPTTARTFLAQQTSVEQRQRFEQLLAGQRVVAARKLFLTVANGVTTIRVMGGDLRWTRDLVARGELLGPRIYAASRWVGAESPTHMAEFPESVKVAGYDFIKAYGIGGEALDSLTAAAHRVGIPIAGHAPGEGASFNAQPECVEQAIRAGFASIEHLSGFDAYLAGHRISADEPNVNSWPAALPVDPAKLRTIGTALRQAHVWSTPTTILFEAIAIARWLSDTDTPPDWPELRYLAKGARETSRSREGHPVATPAQAQAVITNRRQIIKGLHDAGAGLLLGTDSDAFPWVLPGFAVHRELQAFVGAGLTPYEALATGTRNVAEFFGTLDSTGTVAVGKRADLVLLADNPLRDIRATTHIAGVMVNGRWLGRAELDAGLAAAEGALGGE